MKIPNDATDAARYDLDGTLFESLQSAVVAARFAIDREMEKRREDLKYMWAGAGTDLERNKVADYLVCKVDLGILQTFHELVAHLPVELVQLAAEITSGE